MLDGVLGQQRSTFRKNNRVGPQCLKMIAIVGVISHEHSSRRHSFPNPRLIFCPSGKSRCLVNAWLGLITRHFSRRRAGGQVRIIKVWGEVASLSLYPPYIKTKFLFFRNKTREKTPPFFALLVSEAWNHAALEIAKMNMLKISSRLRP